jgi:hypothetical protein
VHGVVVGGCGCASPLGRFATFRRKHSSRTPRPLKMKAVHSFETSGNDYTVAELGCLRRNLRRLETDTIDNTGSNAQLIVLMFFALRAVFEEQTGVVSGG